MKQSRIPCEFCEFVGNTEAQTDDHIIIFDKYPVTGYHTLVIPKRHISTISDYNFAEWVDLRKAIKKARDIITMLYEGQEGWIDFNIGVNDGEHAGQTIKHAHWHIIPRWKGDGGWPCGVRNVFPADADYRKKLPQN